MAHFILRLAIMIKSTFLWKKLGKITLARTDKFNISQSAWVIIEHKGGKTVWLNIGIHKHIPYIQCSFDILSCNSLCINVRSSRSKQDQDHGTV